MRKIYFKNLDGIRTLAFLIVYLSHAINKLPFHFFGYRSTLTRYFKHGDLGVLLFFVLSGFLIVYLIQDEINRKGRLDLRAFYSRRFFRIWPLYFITLIIGFLLIPLINNDYWVLRKTLNSDYNMAIYFLFFLGNFVSAYMPEFSNDSISVLWSVSVEEQFYLLAPIFFILYPKNRNHWIILFSILIIISITFRMFHTDEPSLLNMHTISVMTGLCSGSLLAIFTFRKFSLKKSSLLTLNHSTTLGLYIFIFLLIIFRSFLFHHPYIKPFEILIFSLCFSFLILEQTFFSNSPFQASKNKALSWLGKYTYGLYCFHMIGLAVAGVIYNLLFEVSAELSFKKYLFIIIIGLILTVILAISSYHLIEKKFLLFKKNLVK